MALGRHGRTAGGRLSRTREPLPTRVEDAPPLPAGIEVALDDGLNALAITLTGEARAAILGHLRLLLAWNAAINLTAIRDPLAAIRLHVLDSLSALPLLRAAGVDDLLDLGSGGGYPGVPLAAALPARALLVDSVGKKARFLDVAAAAVALDRRVAVSSSRAEALATGPDREAWAAVTARGVAALDELVELAFPLLVVGGRLVAWKRGALGPELEAAGRAIGPLGGGELRTHSVDDPALAGHVLVEVLKSGPTPARFPRDPGARRRTPW